MGVLLSVEKKKETAGRRIMKRDEIPKNP